MTDEELRHAFEVAIMGCQLPFEITDAMPTYSCLRWPTGAYIHTPIEHSWQAFCAGHASRDGEYDAEQATSYSAGYTAGVKAGHEAAQPKWAEIKGGKYPATHDDVWCLLSNGHIVKGMFFSVAIGWEWDNENDDDADASVTHWALITPPLPPGPGERG